MKNKTLLVYSKEIKVMARDRRLIYSVIIISLVVMPFLMGFIGNIDRMVGQDRGVVDVLVFFDDPQAAEVLSKIDGVRIIRESNIPNDLSEANIMITMQGETYIAHGDGTDPLVREAWGRINQAFESWREKLIIESLSDSGISADVLSPFTIEFDDTADEQQKSGYILSILVPYLVIILLVANAIRATYIAVGEKQHNTLSSLLVSSAPRYAIVLGKSFAIMTFAIFSSILLVVGMIIFANLGFSLDAPVEDINYTLSFGQIFELVINIVSIALFISSVIMYLGTLARNAREAGVYTAPLIYIAIILAVFSFSRSTFSTAVYAIPILGNSLAMKETFVNALSPEHLVLPVIVNIVLFVLLLLGSVRLYNKENVLFRN